MNDDLRQYNGGARKGAGRPKTVDAWHQVAVRLPQDMARWVWRQKGSPAEVLRRLVQEAMEREATQAQAQTPPVQAQIPAVKEVQKIPKTKT